MLRLNRTHTPATSLGHITASRSKVRSTRRPSFLKDESTDSAAPKSASAVTRSDKRSLAQPHIPPAFRKRVRIVSPTKTYIPSTSAAVHLHNYIPEDLTPYEPHECPDIFIRVKVCHSFDFRQDVIFSDSSGSFPVSAFDGSQYLLMSIFKRYIHVEPLLNRTTEKINRGFQVPT